MIAGNFHHNLPSGNLSILEADQSFTSGAYISYPGSGDGYFDRESDGSDQNTLPEMGNGYGLRVSNPSQTRELLIAAPTTDYKNITMSYATKRTNNGARWQQVQYKADDDDTWQDLSPTVKITEDWEVLLFALPRDGVDNNPDLKIRILFTGDEATGSSGNNRFDNMRIEGIVLDHDVSSANSPYKAGADFRRWYSEGLLHVENPFPGQCMLHVYNINGAAIKSVPISANGHHTIPFKPNRGFYIARIIGDEGASSLKFVVE